MEYSGKGFLQSPADEAWFLLISRIGCPSNLIMSTSDSSLTDLLFCAEDLPQLAQSLPPGYDASFFTNVAELRAHPLPLTPSYPAEVAALFNKYGQKWFKSRGYLFDKEADYQATVDGYVLMPLLASSETALYYNRLEFGNNVAADGCVELAESENRHLLKLILDFKSPSSGSAHSAGGPPKAEDLHLHIGQAFEYAKHAYLDKDGNPEYQFEKTVYNYLT